MLTYNHGRRFSKVNKIDDCKPESPEAATGGVL